MKISLNFISKFHKSKSYWKACLRLRIIAIISRNIYLYSIIKMLDKKTFKYIEHAINLIRGRSERTFAKP
jgi:hypothetical protein